MNYVVYFFVFVILCSCSDGKGYSSINTTLESDSIATQSNEKELIVNEDLAPPNTTIHMASLVCKDRGEDEYGVPKNDVYVQYDSIKHKVATCNACAPIDFKEYNNYDIPEEAKSAVGGWFAGGGDYYYIVPTKDQGIEVFAGWQDEGQMEGDDTSFHYKKVYEKHPDGEHKFF